MHLTYHTLTRYHLLLPRVLFKLHLIMLVIHVPFRVLRISSSASRTRPSGSRRSRRLLRPQQRPEPGPLMGRLWQHRPRQSQRPRRIRNSWSRISDETAHCQSAAFEFANLVSLRRAVLGQFSRPLIINWLLQCNQIILFSFSIRNTSMCDS